MASKSQIFRWIKYYYWVYRKYDMIGISNYILWLEYHLWDSLGGNPRSGWKSCWPRLSALLWPVNRFDSLGPDTFEAPPPIATRLASMAPQRLRNATATVASWWILAECLGCFWTNVEKWWFLYNNPLYVENNWKPLKSGETKKTFSWHLLTVSTWHFHGRHLLDVRQNIFHVSQQCVAQCGFLAWIQRTWRWMSSSSMLYPGNRYKKKWKITTLSMGTSTISITMFNSKLFNYQRVINQTMKNFGIMKKFGLNKLNNQERNKWRFIAGKIIYFYGPFSIAMLNNQRVEAPMPAPKIYWCRE